MCILTCTDSANPTVPISQLNTWQLDGLSSLWNYVSCSSILPWIWHSHPNQRYVYASGDWHDAPNMGRSCAITERVSDSVCCLMSHFQVTESLCCCPLSIFPVCVLHFLSWPSCHWSITAFILGFVTTSYLGLSALSPHRARPPSYYLKVTFLQHNCGHAMARPGLKCSRAFQCLRIKSKATRLGM